MDDLWNYFAGHVLFCVHLAAKLSPDLFHSQLVIRMNKAVETNDVKVLSMIDRDLRYNGLN